MTAKLFSRPLKVTLSGFDERSRTRLAMFLEGPARGVCEVVGQETAEAAICDLDGFGGERQWKAFREQFHGPALVMSVGEKHLHNAIWVRKPLNADDFLAGIELISQRLRTERRLREFERAAEKALAASAVASAPPPVVATRPAPRPPVVASPRPASPSPVASPRSASPLPAAAASPVWVPPTPAAAPVWVPTASIAPAVATLPAVVVRQGSVPPSVVVCQGSATASVIERSVPASPPVKATADTESVGRAASLAWNEQQIHDSCGTMDDAVYLDPNRRGELYYEPSDYVQGMLERACQRARDDRQAVRLDVGGQELIVLAGGKQVFCTAREQRLRPLCVTPKPGRLVTMVDLHPSQLPTILPQDPQLSSNETILWVMSLWASRGRVPKGTDIDAPVSLASWPCFSRLQITPHAMQIAALWTTRPMSPMQTAKVLSIPHRYVFTLYSACLALGLIEKTQAIKPALATPSHAEIKAPAEKRSLMGGLLRKLRLAF